MKAIEKLEIKIHKTRQSLYEVIEMFKIKGTVKSIDGSNITVTTFINTRTVDVEDYPVEQIRVGDRIEITKNLSARVIYIRDDNMGRNNLKGNKVINDNGKHKFKGNEKNR